MDIIKLVNHDELAAERLRLLYVALTRARERLYISATIKGSFEDFLKVDMKETLFDADETELSVAEK